MKMYKLKNISAVTLAELIISTALIGLVLLTAGSLDIAARRFFMSAEAGTAAMNDMTVAMEYMVRELERAIGDFSYPAFECTNGGGSCTCDVATGFRVRVDLNDDGRIDASEGYSRSFSYVAGNHQITFNDGTTNTVIAQRVIGFTLERFPGTGNQIREVRIRLSARDDPDEVESITNPTVMLESGAYLRASAVQ